MADVNLSYGRLSAVPSDVQFSIFLNAGPDTLDNLCRNEVFFRYCQNNQYLMQYVLERNPELLTAENGFIFAAEQLRSQLLSKFVAERWIETVNPEDQLIDYNNMGGGTRRALVRNRPKFIKPELINFLSLLSYICQPSKFSLVYCPSFVNPQKFLLLY